MIMGCYDSFIVKGLKCPKGHLQADGELQTKSLGENLQKFKQGQRVRISNRSTILEITEGKVNCYIYCELCEKFYDYIAFIKDGKFQGIQKIKEFS